MGRKGKQTDTIPDPGPAEPRVNLLGFISHSGPFLNHRKVILAEAPNGPSGS